MKKMIWIIIVLAVILAFLAYYAISMNGQVNRLNAELTELSTMLKDSDDAMLKTQNELDGTARTLSQTQADLDKQTAKVAELTDALAANQKELSIALSEKASLENKLGDTEERLALSTEAFIDANTALEALTVELDQAKEDALAKERQAQAADKNAQAANAERDVANLEAESLKIELEAANGKKTDLENMLDEANLTIERDRQAIAAANDKIAGLEAELDALRAAMEAYAAQNDIEIEDLTLYDIFGRIVGQ